MAKPVNSHIRNKLLLFSVFGTGVFHCLWRHFIRISCRFPFVCIKQGNSCWPFWRWKKGNFLSLNKNKSKSYCWQVFGHEGYTKQLKDKNSLWWKPFLRRYPSFILTLNSGRIKSKEGAWSLDAMISSLCNGGRILESSFSFCNWETTFHFWINLVSL